MELNLKSIIFEPGVIRTDITDKVIQALDPFFAYEGITGFISSVLRTKEKQLQIIQDYARIKKIILDGQVLDFEHKIDFEGEQVWYWQLVWSRLLSADIIVNPPIEAKVLTDYMRNGINKKGQIIQPSVHMNGTAFDISGLVLVLKAGNKMEAIDLVFQVALKGAKQGVGIRITSSSPLIEHGNNCVHCNCIA